ncbi:MAG: twin-arginine translocase subunit TatC [Gemmatimonadaceae bacterium]|jgi:sec-independent protein translocase protein TatC|nr:twin-arginine translocase subunit TatC [Gemmatimonadaceae bacterium]
MAKSANPVTEMPFLDHLEELRERLIKVIVALAITVAAAFVLVVKFNAIAFLAQPIQPFLGGKKLVFTHPGDSFTITMTVSLGIGFVLAAPVILYQLWAFVSPALYQREKRIVIPVLVAATFLFALGASAAYFLVLPFALQFLLGFQSEALEAMITARDYFDFATSLCLVMGGVFELPILIVALTALGVVTPMQLRSWRRQALVVSIVAAAIITPGDLVTTTLMLMVPLYGLYEASIIASAIVHRRQQRRAMAAGAEQEALA